MRILMSFVLAIALTFGALTSAATMPSAHADGFDQSFYGDSGDSGLFWQWVFTVIGGGVAIVIGETFNTPGWTPPELQFGGGGSW